MASIKLLSTWFGPHPTWYDQYAAQMARFTSVDWEIIPPYDMRDIHQEKQLQWYNALATERLGTPCRKTIASICDLRPTFGELFADKYTGYDWWGWCDMDVAVGNLDLLPFILGNADGLSLKSRYLSGCFAVFKNEPRLTKLWRESPHAAEIMADDRYHCWDESGYYHLPGESFYKLLVDGDLIMNYLPGLYVYDTYQSSESQPSEMRGGKLYDLTTGREVLVHHFMSDTWPFTPEGKSRLA